MKYKLTEEKKVVFGHTVHRIVCVTAFASVETTTITRLSACFRCEIV